MGSSKGSVFVSILYLQKLNVVLQVYEAPAAEFCIRTGPQSLFLILLFAEIENVAGVY